MSEAFKDPLAEDDFQADDPSLLSPPAIPERLASIDAYRGLVMFLMMAEVLNLRRVARAAGGGPGKIGHHQSHVEWVGCSLHDMIQPSFSFLVGVALPFSVASRLVRGQSKTWMTAPCLWRSLVLVFLGVFLRSTGRSQTNFTFEDTLSQIGLGYPFLFVLAFSRRGCNGWRSGSSCSATGRRSRAIRPPAPDYDYAAVGVPAELVAPSEWVRRPLEQEQQPGLGVRPLVPEPVSPRAGRSPTTAAATPP